MSIQETIRLQGIVPAQLNHQRLDLVLKTLFGQYSRALYQQWITQGFVQVAKQVITTNKFKVKAGDELVVQALQTKQLEDQGEQLALTIVYQDPALIIIDKPVGLVVHPGAGNTQHTLLNGLLYQFPELAKLPRAGLVHRIDKDTSGLLVVARNLISYHFLTQAMQKRQISREYLALVRGVPISGGVINQPIGRHTSQRTLMMVREGGRPAVTHFWIQQRFKRHALLRVKLDTGRTHQIRVHLAFLGYPLVGDKQYNHLVESPNDLTTKQYQLLHAFNHQALHATRLSLPHPNNGQLLHFHSVLPADFSQLIAVLETQ